MSNAKIDPKSLEISIEPNVIFDDIVAGSLFVSLSPEIELHHVSLRDGLSKTNLNERGRAAWASELREIADMLDSEIKGR